MNEYEINIPRGTTMSIGLVIIDENGNTHYDPEDVVRMWVRHDPEDASPVIQKTATYDTDEECFIIALTPADTADLIQDERYWYDIGLQTDSGEFYQVIETAPFNVLRAITRKVTT